MSLKATGSSERFQAVAERYNKLKIFCQHCVDEYFHRVTLSSLASGESVQLPD